MIFLFPRWDMLIPWRVIVVQDVFSPMSRFLQVQLGLAEPDPPPAMPSPPETVRVVPTPAPMTPESVKDSLASTILEAHLFVVNHSLKHVNMRLSSMGQLPLKLAWNSQLTWHPSLSIISAGVRHRTEPKIEQGVFFFPQDPNRNEEIEIPKNGSKKATETGRVSHRWDSMLAQGAPEPVLAAAADRHSSTIIVKHDLGPWGPWVKAEVWNHGAVLEIDNFPAA